MPSQNIHIGKWIIGFCYLLRIYLNEVCFFFLFLCVCVCVVMSHFPSLTLIQISTSCRCFFQLDGWTHSSLGLYSMRVLASVICTSHKLMCDVLSFYFVCKCLDVVLLLVAVCLSFFSSCLSFYFL